MRAKKSFGQHFLINESVARKIAYSLEEATAVRNVLEIGPGKGMLTKYLLEQDINLKVVEADKDMVHYLNAHFPELKGNIIEYDFLKLNMEKVFDGQPFCLIGNYPYNISSQILFKMLNAKHLIPEMVGMFQKEVSDRVIATHGSKIYGLISVLVQAHYEGNTLVKVSPGSFNPPPKVTSSVIRLKRKENYELDCDDRLFRTIVKTSFSKRRKMIRNTLKSILPNPELLAQPFFTNRPEQLSLEDFLKLTAIVEKEKQ